MTPLKLLHCTCRKWTNLVWKVSWLSHVTGFARVVGWRLFSTVWYSNIFTNSLCPDASVSLVALKHSFYLASNLICRYGQCGQHCRSSNRRWPYSINLCSITSRHIFTIFKTRPNYKTNGNRRWKVWKVLEQFEKVDLVILSAVDRRRLLLKLQDASSRLTHNHRWRFVE